MHILLRGTVSQRLRIASGLVLFTFALTHFLNHALGLVDIDTMQTVQDWRTAVTRSVPGTIVLGLALLTHVSLALYKLAGRRTLKIPPWELIQLLLGLSIPFLLIPHVFNTRVASSFYGVKDLYIYELLRLWPDKWPDQTILMLLVWTHACVGLHFWLRLTPTYRKVAPYLLAIAVLIPAAALAGFSVAGREAQAAAADPEALAAIKEFTNWPSDQASAEITERRERARYAFYSLVALCALILALRRASLWFSPRFPVRYVPEPVVRSAAGPTLLEISRMNGIPHASVCGGRARCSTCRVSVLEGLDALPPPETAEAETLRSISAAENVRLACQLRPTGPLAVVLAFASDRALSFGEGGEAQGVERDLAVLFLDVRSFTTISEHKLPYDVVFLLNQLFAVAGDAIRAEGGWIDKYLGDGLMAVFGRESGVEEGCRQALRAAIAIDFAVERLQARLAGETATPLRVGMGIHVGPLVLGRIGHPRSAAMTVIGRTVNVASRLESLTKDKGCQLVVSLAAARLAGVDHAGLATEAVAVRGMSRPTEIAVVTRARDLEGRFPRNRRPEATFVGK